jgi:hypothetical protein
MRTITPTLSHLLDFRIPVGATSLAVAVLVGVGLCASKADAQVRFTAFPSNYFLDTVSADGKVLGGSVKVDGYRRAARWTESGGLQVLPPPFPGDTKGVSQFFRMSSEGRYGVGFTLTGEGIKGSFRQQVGGSYETLPLYPNYGAIDPLGISDDGSIIIGNVRRVIPGGGFPPTKVVRWTPSTGAQEISPPAGSEASEILVRSVDRTGTAFVADNQSALRPVVWREGRGYSSLPFPSTIPFPTSAYGGAISRDGSQIVGTVTNGIFEDRIVIWDKDLNPRDVATNTLIGGFIVEHASDDGSVIVGITRLETVIGGSAVWTAEHGFLLFKDYANLFGVSLPKEWNPEGYYVTGLSSDGRTFVGTGVHGTQSPRWTLTIPSPGSAALLILLGIGTKIRRRSRRASIEKAGGSSSGMSRTLRRFRSC